MPMPKKAIAKPVQEPTKPNKPAADPDKRTRTEQPKRNKQDALRLKRLKRTPMPKQLAGCTPCTEDGKPYCFAFNLGTCSSPTDCEKGLHLCCKKGCGKKHSYISAHKQGS